MIVKVLISSLLVLISFSTYRAQNPSPRLESFFTTSRHPVNGNVLVAENGKIILERSAGYADAGARAPNNAATRFQLASVTKVFTSTAILQLADRGKLKLDDPLTKYFPDFPFAGISLRHLLSHTSGLPDFQIFEEPVRQSPEKVFTNADVIPALRSWGKPLPFKPGDAWSYSNVGYCLLALLVEKLSGQRFEEYVRRNIFAAADMSDSYFETELVAASDPKKAKEQRYRLLFHKDLSPVQFDKWRGFTGNGGAITTARDLLKFDQALYGGKILRGATLEEAFTPAKLNDGSKAKTTTLDAYYGLGWFIFEDDGVGKIVWHGGGRPGIVTVFLRNVTKRQTAVVLDNSFNRETYRIGLSALNILSGRAAVTRKSSLVRDFALELVDKGQDAALVKLAELKFDAANYYLDEDEMNDLALQIFYSGPFPDNKGVALELARMNIAFFPNSFNIYDTYGEILAAAGKRELAIVMYKRSIAMNPNNEGGKRALERLLKQ